MLILQSNASPNHMTEQFTIHTTMQSSSIFLPTQINLGQFISKLRENVPFLVFAGKQSHDKVNFLIDEKCTNRQRHKQHHFLCTLIFSSPRTWRNQWGFRMALFLLQLTTGSPTLDNISRNCPNLRVSSTLDSTKNIPEQFFVSSTGTQKKRL